ncbi:uncharacterised 5xTM membrane YitT family protein [Bacillus oleivorans]|uniref:Uncharacterized 5xTM membrane YitT family protein n=1 Tax=Bacillus oleivorans TaxID=1448271 RepID=A0A285CLB5_9BACI|nr:YitT family protein [Bacillus oleivorans]SNX68330.1 uncharacterised 5xTM membrane YitT family protein [Bacillus oleivorans]
MLLKAIHIIIGSFLLSIGINGCFVPYHLLDGGMIGIGLIIHYLWGIPTGLVILFGSIPLFIMAFFVKRSLFYNSIHGLLISSLFIDLTAPISTWFHFPIIASALIGGILIGTGIGLMLLVETSTGGSDLVGQCISYWTKWNVGVIIFIIDGIVLLIGCRIIGTYAFLHSLLAVSAVGFATSTLVHFGKPSIN